MEMLVYVLIGLLAVVVVFWNGLIEMRLKQLREDVESLDVDVDGMGEVYRELRAEVAEVNSKSVDFDIKLSDRIEKLGERVSSCERDWENVYYKVSSNIMSNLVNCEKCGGLNVRSKCEEFGAKLDVDYARQETKAVKTYLCPRCKETSGRKKS